MTKPSKKVLSFVLSVVLAFSMTLVGVFGASAAVDNDAQTVTVATADEATPDEATSDEATTDEPSTPDELGDVDGNGILSISDATLIQKGIAGIVVLSAEQMTVADVNKDGYVNITDVTCIQKKIAQIIDSFDEIAVNK